MNSAKLKKKTYHTFDSTFSSFSHFLIGDLQFPTHVLRTLAVVTSGAHIFDPG